MLGSAVKRVAGWAARRSDPLLLIAAAAGLVAGGVASLAGAGDVADAAWLAAAACGLGYALWAAIGALRRGRLGVDVIALLALAGAIAVGELLAAADGAPVSRGPGGNRAARGHRGRRHAARGVRRRGPGRRDRRRRRRRP